MGNLSSVLLGLRTGNCMFCIILSRRVAFPDNMQEKTYAPCFCGESHRRLDRLGLAEPSGALPLSMQSTKFSYLLNLSPRHKKVLKCNPYLQIDMLLYNSSTHGCSGKKHEPYKRSSRHLYCEARLISVSKTWNAHAQLMTV